MSLWDKMMRPFKGEAPQPPVEGKQDFFIDQEVNKGRIANGKQFFKEDLERAREREYAIISKFRKYVESVSLSKLQEDEALPPIFLLDGERQKFIEKILNDFFYKDEYHDEKGVVGRAYGDSSVSAMARAEAYNEMDKIIQQYIQRYIQESDIPHEKD